MSAKIRDEKLQTGDPLPSEAQLAAQFAVSRITVRHALTRLEFDGLIERRQGKGTFVSRPKLVHRDRPFRALEDEIRAQGRLPSFLFNSYGEVEAPRKVQERLLSQSSGRIFLLRRVKLLDGVPWALETRFFPERVGKLLDARQVAVLPIYELLEAATGRFPKHLTEAISASVATGEEAASLHVQEGHPVLVSDHTMFDDGDAPVECGKTIFRGDRYEIHLQSRRQP